MGADTEELQGLCVLGQEEKAVQEPKMPVCGEKVKTNGVPEKRSFLGKRRSRPQKRAPADNRCKRKGRALTRREVVKVGECRLDCN